MKPRRVSYGLLLFSVPWVCVVCLFTYAFGFSYVKQSRASRNYVCVNATGVSSRVEQSSNGEGRTSYTPVIIYRYDVGGATYESRRYNFAGRGFDYHEAHYAADYYKPGAQFVAFYDPEDPSEAVLDPSPVSPLFAVPMTLFLLLFGGFTLLILYAALRGAEADAQQSDEAVCS